MASQSSQALIPTDERDVALTDAHRMLVQIFMSEQIIADVDLKRKYQTIGGTKLAHASVYVL